MPKKMKWSWIVLSLAVVLTLGVVLSSVSAGPCYGTLYEYFDGPAHNVQTGAKVVCAGFPNQYDSGDNGGYQETSWFTTTQVVCPCQGGGGGGGDNPNCPYEDPAQCEE